MLHPCAPLKGVTRTWRYELGRFPPNAPEGMFHSLCSTVGCHLPLKRSLDQKRKLVESSRFLGRTIATELCRFKVSRLLHTHTRIHHRKNVSREKHRPGPEQVSCSDQLRATGHLEERQASSKTFCSRIGRALQLSAVILPITLDVKPSSHLS